MEGWPADTLRFGLALLGGIVLGYAARRGRFCTLGAVEDASYGRDFTRLRSWALATATAIVLTQALSLLGIVEIGRSIHLSHGFDWLGSLIGGLAFGFGMALVGTCGFGTLLRTGGGDLRALVTFLVMAVFAYATMRGLPGLARVALIEPLRHQEPLAVDAKSLEPDDLAATLVVLGLLLVFAFRQRDLAARPLALAAGVSVGAVVAYGWWVTGFAGDDPFDPARVESYSFVAPLGETVVYFMTASGARLDFAHGAVCGVLLGAFLAALQGREFRWEAYDDAREMRRHLGGAILMGTGGVVAFGCTIGQGVTGVSTLSASSFLATAAILAGARAGLYWLVEWPLREPRRRRFGRMEGTLPRPANSATGSDL